MSPLMRASILAAVLVVVDAFVMNQGVISIFFALGLVLVGLPRAFLRRFAPVRRARLLNLAIYAFAVVLVLVLNNANNRIARSRADLLVPAVTAFHVKYHKYPESLGALVPEFVARIPRAKYTLQYGEFTYFVADGKAFLYYVAVPPFGRPAYDFAKGSWGYLD